MTPSSPRSDTFCPNSTPSTPPRPPRFWPVFLGLCALLGLLLSLAFSLLSNPLAFAQEGGGPPVEVITLEPSSLSETIGAVGTLRANESVVLRPEIGGILQEIAFEEGQQVSEGELLFRLDGAVQQAQLDRALAELELRRSDFRRTEKLLKDSAISQREFDEARARMKLAEADAALARAQVEKTRIPAPFSGTLGLRSVSEGDYLQPGQALVNLADSSRLKVDFRIPETLADRVRVGQKIRLRPGSRPDEVLTGTVYAIDPLIDTDGRALVVRGWLDNPGKRLRPGQFVTLELLVDTTDEALMVPEQAVIAQLGNHFVWTVVEGKTAMAPVQLGERRRGFVEVTEGLGPGATVITGGHQKIGPGMPVTAIPVDASMFARDGQPASANP